MDSGDSNHNRSEWLFDSVNGKALALECSKSAIEAFRKIPEFTLDLQESANQRISYVSFPARNVCKIMIACCSWL
jgi:hypothetical protein